MMTVKEISSLTGISVRTLHYYDEIELLQPTLKNAAGYRLYDDKALEYLQQILFFREFDISLKEIKSILETPNLDRNKILQIQRKMLLTKKERIQGLINNIDDILRGGNKMNFELFNRTEIEQLCQITIERMPALMKENIIQEFGSMEKWKKNYLERASKEDMQQGYQKLVEWYGGNKEKTIAAITTHHDPQIVEALQNRIDAILTKLIAEKLHPIDSFTVKSIIGEYSFVMKEFFQIKEEKELMLSVAKSYRDERAKNEIDNKYGNGSADYFAQAIESFYHSD